MNIICYGIFPGELFHGIWEELQKRIPELGFEVHRKVESLASRLRQPGRNVAAVILHISEGEKMSDLFSLRALLDDVSVIALLDEQKPEILKDSFRLNPRLVLYTFMKNEDVCAALEQCIRKFRREGPRV